MSNYIEYKDKIAFHPGYYIKEIIDDSGLTQEDFAKKLDTTPKNLSCLVRGEQKLSNDMAMKLSRMLGTSVSYWLNLQKAYDEILIEIQSKQELEKERHIIKQLRYQYFKKYFDLPDLPRKVDQQVETVRSFLNVSSLNVLEHEDLMVSFRSSASGLSEENIVKANAMVQIAINLALKEDGVPPFDKEKFDDAVNTLLNLTTDHETFYPLAKKALLESGVIFVVLPNLPGSKINGATKKLGNTIMLMVSDRGLYSDFFWFSLFHEIGHIKNGDFGISFIKESGKIEEQADRYAEDALIPPEQYQSFTRARSFTPKRIREFASSINRDPAIVLGRLENDGLVSRKNQSYSSLRHKYKVTI